MLQRAVAVVARSVSGDARQVLADGSPIVKKVPGLMCCHRWILLLVSTMHGVSISFSHHHKVDGQRVPYLWIQGSPMAVWAVCARYNP